MTQEQVVALMASSKTEGEWNANCDKVKAEFVDYPDWWYTAIVLSGVAGRTMAKFGGPYQERIVENKLQVFVAGPPGSGGGVVAALIKKALAVHGFTVTLAGIVHPEIPEDIVREYVEQAETSSPDKQPNPLNKHIEVQVILAPLQVGATAHLAVRGPGRAAPISENVGFPNNIVRAVLPNLPDRMDISSPPGTKVRYDGEGGYAYEREKAAKILKPGEIYTVRLIEIRSSSSSVMLMEFPDRSFNTTLFAAM